MMPAPPRQQRRVAIVSPYFPPSTLAGVHRARLLARHLPAAGWEPVIVCVDERCHEEPLDPLLAETVPATTAIVKVRAVSSALTRKLGIGDLGLRGFSALRRAVTALAEQRRIDAVMITGSPYYPMLMAPDLKRRFGLPVILDFQDPWVSDWGKSQAALSKAGLSHQLARRLEPVALRGAAWVTSVSEGQNRAMARDYPWLDSTRMGAIPIGGDPEDFDILDRMTDRLPPPPLEAGAFNFSYVGTFLPRAGEVVRCLFRGVAALRQRAPGLASRLRFNFIGTSNQPGDHATFRVMPIAAEEGVAELVRETPRRLPYLEALAALRRSDALLLLGSDEAHYTASKIYPGLMSGRPFLSLFHEASSAHAILSAAGGGRSFAFGSPSGLGALVDPVSLALQGLARNETDWKERNPAAYTPFTAAAVSGRFAGILDSLTAERGSRTASAAEPAHG